MTDGRRQIWLSPPPFAPKSSALRLPLSETNTYRARGRNALPDGDRWTQRDSRLDRRGQNLTKAALLGGRDGEVNWIGPLLRSRIRHGRACRGHDVRGRTGFRKARRPAERRRVQTAIVRAPLRMRKKRLMLFAIDLLASLRRRRWIVASRTPRSRSNSSFAACSSDICASGS